MTPLIKNDAIVFGLLILIIATVTNLSKSKIPVIKKIFDIFPPVLFCYFIPAILNSCHIISGKDSELYKVASRYLLPASLALFCLCLDLKAILNLGPKALIMFIAATAGVIIGGPFSLWVCSYVFPELLNGHDAQEVWKGLATLAGTWIGGAANQTAIKEIYKPSTELFGITIAVDILISNAWMALLLFCAGNASKIDKYLKADPSSLQNVLHRIENFKQHTLRIPSFADIMLILGIGFGATAFSHGVAEIIVPVIKDYAPGLSKFSLTSDFFWIVLVSTAVGIVFSFSKFRNLEGAGASNIGSVFLYIMITTIGMNMDIMALEGNISLLVVGVVWILFHGLFLLLVAKLIKASFFFVAVSSQAIIGGAASAPVVASAFHPALAPVGVLLAVLGYAVGTYGAIICAHLMQLVK